MLKVRWRWAGVLLLWAAWAPAAPATSPATQPIAKVQTDYNAATNQTVVRVPLGGISLMYMYEGQTPPEKIVTVMVQPGSNGWLALDWIVEGPKRGWTVSLNLPGGGRVNASHLKGIMADAKKVRYRLWGYRSRREGVYTADQLAAINDLLSRTSPAAPLPNADESPPPEGTPNTKAGDK